MKKNFYKATLIALCCAALSPIHAQADTSTMPHTSSSKVSSTDNVTSTMQELEDVTQRSSSVTHTTTKEEKLHTSSYKKTSSTTVKNVTTTTQAPIVTTTVEPIKLPDGFSYAGLYDPGSKDYINPPVNPLMNYYSMHKPGVVKTHDANVSPPINPLPDREDIQ